MPKPLVHSFSSLKYFSGCQHRYAEVKIRKTFKDTPYVATEDGKILHDAFERAITTGALLPDGLIKYQPEVDMLKALPGAKHCELKMGLTHTGEATGYWDSNAWVRGAADFVHVQDTHAICADYKTGKVRPDPDQLHLMATMIFRKFPWVKTVRGVLMFVEHKVIHTENYSVDNFVPMWSYWVQKMAKTEKAIQANSFTKNPSGLCKGYCPVASCEHYEPLRSKT